MTTALLDRVAGRRIIAAHRVFYLFDSDLDTSEGRLDLMLDDGVIGFRAGPDGQSLVVDADAWVDPFREPLSDENREYVRTHGRWTLVDVSSDPGWVDVVGHEVTGVSVRRDSGFVAGVSIAVGGGAIEVEVVADELHAEVGGRPDRAPPSGER